MKQGYKIEHGLICSVNEVILVYNYAPLNLVQVLPSINYSCLLENKSQFLVGIWKIKTLKN